MRAPWSLAVAFAMTGLTPCVAQNWTSDLHTLTSVQVYKAGGGTS